MREFFISLGLILVFGYILGHLYVDVINYKNSYTQAMGGIFAEGMTNNQIQNSNGNNSLNNSEPVVSEKPIIMQEQEQAQRRQQLGDNTMDTSQPEIENDYASIENPRDFSIFNRDIMKKVLASKNLIPDDINLAEENQFNYIRIGKSFIEEVAFIRNFSVPHIDETDYETLGRFTVKLLSSNISASQQKVYSEKILEDVHTMLAKTSLTNSSVVGESNPGMSTTKRTTGMYGDNSNAIMKKKLKLAGVPMDDAKFTDSKKPKEQKVQPYNSAWGLF